MTNLISPFQYHPSGQAFATASEDKSARLFDLRSDQQIASYQPSNPNSGFTSCGTSAYRLSLAQKLTILMILVISALSHSGRYVFCGSDDNAVHSWDTLKTTYTGKLRTAVIAKLIRTIIGFLRRFSVQVLWMDTKIVLHRCLCRRMALVWFHAVGINTFEFGANTHSRRVHIVLRIEQLWTRRIHLKKINDKFIWRELEEK